MRAILISNQNSVLGILDMNLIACWLLIYDTLLYINQQSQLYIFVNKKKKKIDQAIIQINKT